MDMLEHLFGSRTRVKLLGLFLRQPDEPLFVREMTRRIETQINAVRRELSNLVSFGLVQEMEGEPDGKKDGKKQAGMKKKYYRINPTFPLLNEVRSLFVKAQVLLERKLDKEILKLGDIRYLAFLGTFIGKPSGPVDVFIVGDRINRDALKKLIVETERDMSCEINFSFMTTEDYAYRKDMTDKFLYAILEAPKNVVVDKLAERRSPSV